MEKINEAELKITQSKTTAPSMDEPEETIEQKKENLRRAFGLTSLEHTFENWKHRQGTEKAFLSFKEMAEGNHKPMLLLVGKIGNGKTYLCEALSIAWYRQGIRCPVTLWSELRRQLLQKMHRPKQGEDYDKFFYEFRARKYMIIDDVGMGSKGTDWEMAELEDIINYRYRERLVTVMTTNKTPDELPERVISRFCDPEVSEVVENQGSDYRVRKL